MRIWQTDALGVPTNQRKNGFSRAANAGGTARIIGGRRMSDLIDRRLKVLADALDGCPLTYPCDKLWSPEGWCRDHCKAGQQEPDAECWLKYAEVVADE